MRARSALPLLIGLLLLAPAVTVRAQDTGDSETSTTSAFSPLISCVKESRQLGVLVLLDMSQSLQLLDGEAGTDPRDQRVEASKEAIDAIYRLGQRLASAGRPVPIDVRFDGFGETYRQGRWTRLQSSEDLERAKDEAEKYRRFDNESFTNYSAALNQAADVLDDYDGSCSLLLWFTDGRYDTDNDNKANAPTYGESEIAEIEGDALCGARGPVERLRKAERPLVAVGLGKETWSDSRRAREFALVRSIAEGEPVPPNAGLKTNFICGTSKALGVFKEVKDASTLVEELVLLIADALVEITDDPKGEADLRWSCPASSEICAIDFVLGNYVKSFALYVETPETSTATFTLSSPTGDVRTLADAGTDVGLGISATRIGSWLWLEGTNPSPDDWTGRWTLQVSTYDETVPNVFAQIIPGVAAVETAVGFAPSLSELNSDDLDLQLTLGEVPLVENAVSEPLEPDISLMTRLGDSERLVKLERVTDDESGNSTRIVRMSDLNRLTEGAQGWEWGLELEGEASFTVLDSEKYRVDIEPAILWLDADTQIEIKGSQVIDLEEWASNDSNEGIELLVTRSGVRVPKHTAFEVTIDVSMSIGGSEVRRLDTLTMKADGSFEVPPEEIDAALRTANGTRLHFDVTPTVTHLMTGTTRRLDDPVTASIGIRADDGLPVLFEDHDVADVTADNPRGPVTVTLQLERPREGVGSVQVLSIVTQPELPGEWAGKRFEVSDKAGCDDITPGDDVYKCPIEISHDWTAAIDRVSGLEIEVQVDGTAVAASDKQQPETFLVDDFGMGRPRDNRSFWRVIALASLAFVLIQLLVRAAYTTVIAKWIPTPLGSRYAEIAVRITDANDVVPTDSNRLRVEPQDLKFASEFERARSHGQIGEQTFTIGWLKTFIGERRGLTIQQEPMVRVTSPGNFVIGPEGFDPPTTSGCAGVVPVGLARAWTIRIPSSARMDLANKAAVNGVLWFMLRPENEQPIDVQLDRLQQTLESAAVRNIGALRSALETPVPEADSDTEPEVVNRKTDSTPPPASPDPFNAPSSDPFGGPSPAAPTNSSDQPSSPRPPSSGFDPFA